MTLRELAEKVALENAAASTENVSQLSSEEIRKTLHNLRVHQIELEMQNEELRQAQLERDVAQARYVDLYDEAPVGYCTLAESGVIEQANLTAAGLLGVKRADLLEKPISHFVLKEDQDAFYLLRKNTFISGLPQQTELRLVKGDGSTFWAHLAATAGQDEAGGKLLRLVLNDIAMRHQTEEALRQREQYLRALLDNFPFMVWLKDEESRFLAVNKVFATSFNKPSAESLIGCNDFDIVPPERAQQYRADDQAVLASGAIKQVEEPTGIGEQFRWVETYKSPVVLNGRVLGTVGFARDITERKNTEAALIAAMDEAERANNAKSRFLAAASHDLRQPLTALRLFADILRSKVGAPEQALFASMDDCIVNLSGLLGDLLDLSKLEAGVVKPNIADFSVFELLASLESIYMLKAQAKDLHLRFAPTRLTGRSDPILFKRLLGNFIDNAIRYTAHGGVVVGCRRRQGKTWIEVRDSGIGIAADQTKEIFEEFKQLGDQARNKGSGLGLAIVQKTAALLGLEVSVRSWPGRGSVFAIELPLGQPEALALPASPVAKGQSLRIALVEDNPLVLQAMVYALQEYGHQVVAAASKAALLAELGALPPNVVVSDYRLAEGETGFDVITAVQARFGSALPALLITGDTAPELLRCMTERGILVLHKPVTLDDLQACLEDLTRQAT